MGLSYQQRGSAELSDLITAAQADEHDDSSAMNEIVQRFDGKARHIAGAVCLRLADRDDIANAARQALVRAVRRHRPDLGGFITYVTIFMSGAARRESKRLAYSHETCLSGPDLVWVADRVLPPLHLVADRTSHWRWGEGHISKIIASLPPRQQQMLAERYIYDLDLAAIAHLHGTSESAVSQRLKTAHRHVLAMMPPVSAS